MRFHRHGFAILLLTLLAATASRAAAGPTGSAAPGAARSVPALSEIRAVLDDEHATRIELQRRLRGAHDEARAAAIRDELARVQFEAELAVLRVQAKHARASGREAVAAFLEGAIRAMHSPPVRLPVDARPVPSLRTLPESAEVPRLHAGR